jgi:hypothetical protein
MCSGQETRASIKPAWGVLVRVAGLYGKVVVIETPNPLSPNFTQEWRDRVQSYAADARGVLAQIPKAYSRSVRLHLSLCSGRNRSSVMLLG